MTTLINTEDDQRRQLAQRLREAREYAGLSQEIVSNALGISRTAVTNIESGTRKVEALELNILSSMYGRTVEYLLNGKTEALDKKLSFLARATQGLTEKDLEELERFALFLKNTPKKK
jgi:transcriptional regulator with XRE-family HTH domain